jgi:probable rRNA maturation factor
VDDETIHGLNRRFLDHDFPTDVITFPLEEEDGHLEGEIVASFDTARREAGRFGWPAADELLLYVIHGALHLLGYDDTTADAAGQMREQERVMLAHFGRSACYDEPNEPTESCSPKLEETV